MLVRERATAQHRRIRDDTLTQLRSAVGQNGSQSARVNENNGAGQNGVSACLRRRNERILSGKVKVDCDRPSFLYISVESPTKVGDLVTASALKTLIRLLYMLSPVRPERLLPRL
ncbi:MAG: hypothetical protein ACREOZ_05085, partial [Gloeomargaritales cyanobacterium]